MRLISPFRTGFASIIMLLLAANCFGSWTNPPFVVETVSDGLVVGNHVFVKLKAGYGEGELFTAASGLGAVIEEQLLPNCFVVSWNSQESVESLFSSLAANQIVEHVGYDHVIRLTQWYPPDTHFADQWSFDDTRTPSFDIDAPEAWSIRCSWPRSCERGSFDVGIYLLDTGFPMGCHPDLDEISYFEQGPQFCTPLTPDAACFGPQDNHGHGTAMSSIISGETQTLGAANYHIGVAPECRLFVSSVVQRFERFGCQIGGAEIDAFRAMQWAWEYNQLPWPEAESDIRVIVAPWTFPSSGWTILEEAIQEFLLPEPSILLVASTGHHGIHEPPTVQYPAALAASGHDPGYTDGYPNVLAVTAYDRNGDEAPWANWIFPNGAHPEKLIAAPGGTTDPNSLLPRGADDIAVDYPSNAQPCHLGMIDPQECGDFTREILAMPPQGDPQPLRGRWSGTSCSAAHAGGVAGLVFSMDPSLSAGEVRQVLLDSAKPTNQPHLGTGTLNALRAVLRVPAPKAVTSYGLEIPQDIGSVYLAGELHNSYQFDERRLAFPSVEVYFADGATIRVDHANFSATGTQFIGNASARIQIVNASNSPVEFSNCLFEDFGLALRVGPANGYQPDYGVDLSGCFFANCGTSIFVREGSRVTVDNSSIWPYGPWGVFNMGQLLMTGSMIQGAWRNGITSMQGSSTFLDGVELTSNGSADGDLHHGGIRNVGGAMRLHCVTSANNHGPGLTCPAGGYTNLGSRVDQVGNDGKNCILDNAALDNLTRTQIYFGPGSNFDLCNGRNRIMADDGALIMDANTTRAATVYRNFWGGRESEPGALPPLYEFAPVDNTPDCQRLCDLPNFGNCVAYESGFRFEQALDMEFNMLYEDAIEGYKSIITDFPQSKEAKLCPDRILFCDKYTNADWPARRSYLLTIADTTNEQDVEYECLVSAAWCLVEMGEFEQAELELVALLDEFDEFYKYHKTSLLQLLAELKALEMEPGPMSLGRSPDRSMEILQRVEAFLDENFGPVIENAVPLPSSFALHQNYPNPFNPSTEFSFDLPEGSIVELKVFDILGREVATVVDKYFEAGTHHINWDSRSTGSTLASGVYIYQIKSGGFTDAKKMILLR